MFIPQNAVFSRFQLIPNMKPHDFGISALRIFSAAWKTWSASSPFPAPSGPPWLQTLASWFWTDKVIGSPESNKMMWICLIGFQQNSWHVFTNYYYSTSSWFSVLRPQAEWIFRSVRQRSRGDLHFVAVNLANSKALNLVPFLQWHLLGTWSIAPPNHPMMPWPSMAYKTQFLHLNGHNFGAYPQVLPISQLYHVFPFTIYIYIYIPWHSSSSPYPHISCWVIHSRCAATAAPCTYPDPYPTDWWSKGHRALTRCWRRHRTSTGFNGSIVRKFVGENGKAKEAQNWGSARSADSRCPTISHD